MKRLYFLLFMLCSILCRAQKNSDALQLSEQLVIAEVTDKHTASLIIDPDKLLQAINREFPEKDAEFDAVYLRTAVVNNHTWHYLECTTHKSNRTLVKWLRNTNGRLDFGQAEGKAFSLMSTFFICEGEASCYPRLLFIDGMYGWSCRETSACVSDAFAKQHPCSCTKGRLF
ncbi:MAG: hypothetical protein QM743_13395 [Chitinophagaceae bacterium]